MDADSKELHQAEGYGRIGRRLSGLLVTQAFGQFNDQAFKQVVTLLVMAPVLEESAKLEKTALAQIALMLPLPFFSLPAGVLADRVSKRFVIVAMKVAELALMLAGAAVLYLHPSGGLPAMTVLFLVGVQTALFIPAKYGILPELLPQEDLSEANGLLETISNLLLLTGLVCGGLLYDRLRAHLFVAPLILAGFSALGLLAALKIPLLAPARAEGGLIATIEIAWRSIKADRVLGLALIGQILVWTLGTLVPPPILAYDAAHLGLRDWQVSLPLAAMGIGVGVGCLLAGKISGPRVEYGLLPFGALGLAITSLAFALIGPKLLGTIVVLALLGLFSGFLIVPLNAILQLRSPPDRRGAVLAVTNALVYGGMLLGSILALILGHRHIDARGTFYGTGFVLGCGFLWSLSLVPQAFLRFLMVGLAHTVYRVRAVGRSNVPACGGVLLIPNHVTFADGLFIVTTIDRPVRFMVYHEYFDRFFIGWVLRSMKAIPIASSGGPKMILHAFREAGKALDEGDVVCIFPEGQLTRTGLMAPFQRGLQRIVKGRTTPIIPVHLDRLNRSLFSPANPRRVPARLPYPMTISFGPPLAPDASLFEMRQAIRRLDREAWAFRRDDLRPLHHGFIHQARRHPLRLALVDAQTPAVSFIKALAGAVAIARGLRARWLGQANVGILLPASAGGAVANLAVSLAAKTAVNLNFTTGRVGMERAAALAGLKILITSREFLAKGKIDPPGTLELVFVEDVKASIKRFDRWLSLLLAFVAPIRMLERRCGAQTKPELDDTATVIFSSGSTGDPKGVVLSHFNIGSNIEAIAQIYRVLPNDRLMGILPFFHSFGYTMFWFAANTGMGMICHPSPLEAAMIGSLVERFRGTVLLATPTFLQLYQRRCTPAQFGSLRLILVGAEKLPEALGLSFEDTFGIRPMEGYGLTECSPVVAVNTFDWREPGYFQPGARRGYVGQPLPGVMVSIVSNDTGEPLGPDEQGMVLVKGPNVMHGYLGRDDLTKEAFREGWYITGDQGLLSEDGFLKITGRLSRFSKIGGEMVPHVLIEEILNEAVPAATQLFAVAAVGDERKGERLVVLHTADEKQVEHAFDALAAKDLPNLFVPKRDQFYKVDAIPILGTGKLDLRALRKMAEEAAEERVIAGAGAN
jgi:acyl-[acyl-carrier-protein]-phospholipid O-acyltransferase / long-chain-fatty-acid--[acyl-carrier-protein] ligase